VTITDTNNGGAATAPAGGTYALTPNAATGGTFHINNYLVTYHAGTLTVNPSATTTSLSLLINPAVPGQSVTFTVTVAAVAPGGGTPTGSVTFTSGSTSSGTIPLVGGQASWTTSYASAGSPVITATYTPDTNPSGSSNYTASPPDSKTQTVLGPGVYASYGTTLYIVGGSTTSDSISVTPAGSMTDGTTGLAVIGKINKASISQTFGQAFAAIVFAGYAGNETFALAPSLTLPATVTAGDGNDSIQLGGGNNTVALGDGNDSVTAGDGNNTVTVGNGKDTTQLGDGSNVVVEGNGKDSVSAGNGNNLIVGGLGRHTIKVGNGTNILIDGSTAIVNPGDSFRQILNAWTANPVASNQATIRSRFTVNYNAKYANTLTAGSGIDWFFYLPPTTSNKKSTDFLN
jgi:Ca2+-binding RTX toxin-like protein